jgi:hypothetical protein
VTVVPLELPRRWTPGLVACVKQARAKIGSDSSGGGRPGISADFAGAIGDVAEVASAIRRTNECSSGVWMVKNNTKKTKTAP